MKAKSVNHHHLQSKISDIRNHLPHMFCNNPNRVKWSSWSSIWGQHTHSQSIRESTDSSNFNGMSRLSIVNSILDINKLHCADDFTSILFFLFSERKNTLETGQVQPILHSSIQYSGLSWFLIFFFNGLSWFSQVMVTRERRSSQIKLRPAVP